jgi:hypothetical protein
MLHNVSNEKMSLTFCIHEQYIFDTAQISELYCNQHVPQCKIRDINVATVGTVVHAPADVELNPVDKG